MTTEATTTTETRAAATDTAPLAGGLTFVSRHGNIRSLAQLRALHVWQICEVYDDLAESLGKKKLAEPLEAKEYAIEKTAGLMAEWIQTKMGRLEKIKERDVERRKTTSPPLRGERTEQTRLAPRERKSVAGQQVADDDTIHVLAPGNPKKVGSKARDKFELFMKFDGQSASRIRKEFVKAGFGQNDFRDDLKYNLAHGYVGLNVGK